MPYTQSQFIAKYLPPVKKALQGTGITPELTIAQAILESSGKIDGTWYVGGSSLARKYNNYFGVKAGSSWTGEKVKLPTREVVNGKNVMVDAYFRVYPSIEASIVDHGKVLLKNWPNIVTTDDPKQQVKILQAKANKKYATDPNYVSAVSKLIDLIRGNKTSSKSSDSDKNILPEVVVSAKPTYYRFAAILAGVAFVGYLANNRN